jgi:hypothetical protein
MKAEDVFELTKRLLPLMVEWVENSATKFIGDYPSHLTISKIEFLQEFTSFLQQNAEKLRKEINING